MELEKASIDAIASEVMKRTQAMLLVGVYDKEHSPEPDGGVFCACQGQTEITLGAIGLALARIVKEAKQPHASTDGTTTTVLEYLRGIIRTSLEAGMFDAEGGGPADGEETERPKWR